MPSDRTTILGGVWADGAVDPPGSPVEGVTYADSGLTGPEIAAAWPFKNVVGSAKINEFLRRISLLLGELESWGLLPWCATTTYATYAHVLGSNGKIYRALGTTTGEDPTMTPASWSDVSLETHAALTAPHGMVSAATANRGILRDSNARAKVADPVAADEIATKGYVDGRLGGYVCVVDEKAQNSGPGSYTAAAGWKKRDLTRVVSDVFSYAALANNEVELDAGVYNFKVSAPMISVSRHMCRLMRRRGAAVSVIESGTSVGQNDTYSTDNRSEVVGTLTAEVGDVFYLEHRADSNGNLGAACNFAGAPEKYAVLEFWKVA